MPRLQHLLLPIFFLSSLPLLASGPDDLEGLWVTADAKSVVCIEKENDRYQGRILALRYPVYRDGEQPGLDGQAKIDTENPDQKLRRRPIIGLEIMDDFDFAKKGKWDGGWIYDPDNGKTYRCQIHLKADGTLDVRGYVGIPLFGRTTLWEPYQKLHQRETIFPDFDPTLCGASPTDS